MDSTVLVEPDIEGGRRLVSKLDAEEVKVTAALWLYSSSSDAWRLLIASPMVDSKGPKATYECIQSALIRHGLSDRIPLWYISVVSPESDLIQLLRTAIRTGHDLKEIRFKDNTINGTVIEDAVIYRME